MIDLQKKITLERLRKARVERIDKIVEKVSWRILLLAFMGCATIVILER